jgi:prepilin-type processing-associated H-X9-DG protein/prepilin-type N-terminal cleavage/methylation domain-containing protein
MFRAQPEFVMRGRVKAFTLVEILVVIGIIAVLIGILVPTISKARESSRTAGCLMNLRQLTTAAYSYSVDNSQYIIPVGNSRAGGAGATSTSYWWCNILVDGKYLPAPSDPNPGMQPQMRGPFFCPSGNQDVAQSTSTTSIPPSRIDEQGAEAVRRISNITGITIDIWYGINGENADPPNNSGTVGTPCRRLQLRYDQMQPGIKMTTMGMIKKPSEMVLLYDGILYNQTTENGNRINARHGNKTQTNIGFFDGHAETFRTQDLPGGMPGPKNNPADTQAAFSLSNLKANYPRPLWLLEQQY